MPQDRFDEWLKKSVDGYQTPVDLDADWHALSQRLGNKKKRRLGFIWWWGAPVAALLFLSGYFLFSSNNAGTNSVTNFIEKDKTDVSQYQKITPSKNDQVMPLKSGNEQFAQSLENVKTDLDEATPNTESSVTIKDNNNGENSLHIAAQEPTNEGTNWGKQSLKQNHTQLLNRIEAKESDANENENQIELTNHTYTDVRRGVTSIVPPIVTKLSTVEQDNHELLRPSTLKVHEPSKASWQIDFGMMVGSFSSNYLDAKDQTAIAAFNEIEKPKESFSISLLIYRHLGDKWYLGSGIEAGMRHLTYAQDFTDTVQGKMDNQIIKIIEDFDGQVSNIYGTGNGQTVYDVNRQNHQVFYSLSVPVVVKKDFSLGRKWSITTQGGIVPTINSWRQGYSIVSSSSDLALVDLNDRYANNLTAHLTLTCGLNYAISPSWDLYGGLRGNYQVLGQKEVNELWNQQMNDYGVNLGIRKSF